MDEFAPLSVRVWGEYACFTRPETKVERVSYPVPTPSAARGLLEAIFWRPEFHWQVLETRVLKPIRFVSVLRNEVSEKASFQAVSQWPRSQGHYLASDAKNRTQRHTLALADVDYVIVAQIVLAEGAGAHPAKYRDQFRRRLARGQCFARPYLGCREFAAEFGPADGSEQPIPASMDLGLMLWDLDYREAPRLRPIFFQATLTAGVVRYPSPQEVQACC